VIYEQDARELLSLIDQIHLWAITEYRTFVLEHLRPWHRLCEENYLLEWDSKYDVPAHKKRKRACSDMKDLVFPEWVADMQESSRRIFQIRAALSLEEAIQHSSLIKGKFQCQEEIDSNWTCMVNGCEFTAGSDVAYLDHLRRAHSCEDRDLAQIRWHILEEDTKTEVRARQKRGVMATGRRWPDYIERNPFQEQEAATRDIFSNNRSKRRKIQKKLKEAVSASSSSTEPPNLEEEE
jgi:hypothetical protein